MSMIRTHIVLKRDDDLKCLCKKEEKRKMQREMEKTVRKNIHW